MASAEDLDAESLTEAIRNNVDDAELPPRPSGADEGVAAPRGGGHHRRRVIAVHVDDRRPARGEDRGKEPELGGEIVRDGRMVVHMVAAEIGEAGGSEPETVKPALIEPVARRLDRGGGDALPRETRKGGMEGDRVRRGQAAIGAPAAADHAERADRRRFLAGACENLAGEGCDRGLAAGPGDGDELLRLPSVEARRHQRERAPRVVCENQGDAGAAIHLCALAGEDGDGAALDRIGDEAAAIGG